MLFVIFLGIYFYALFYMLNHAYTVNSDMLLDAEDYLIQDEIDRLTADNDDHYIICIVGASGSGKTSLSTLLQEKYNIPYICSYTTRPMREGETDGIEHRFVSVNDMPDKDKMCAYTLFGNNHYWTTYNQIEEHPLSTYVIDENGILFFKEKCKDKPNYHLYFVKVIRDDLENIDVDRKQRDSERIQMSDDTYDLILYNNSSLSEAAHKFMDWCEDLLFYIE